MDKFENHTRIHKIVPTWICRKCNIVYSQHFKGGKCSKCGEYTKLIDENEVIK